MKQKKGHDLDVIFKCFWCEFNGYTLCKIILHHHLIINQIWYIFRNFVMKVNKPTINYELGLDAQLAHRLFSLFVLHSNQSYNFTSMLSRLLWR